MSTTPDPLDRARAALHAVREYQRLWLEHGTAGRLCRYYDLPPPEDEGWDSAVDSVVDHLCSRGDDGDSTKP